jgi:hypothetical protein
MKIQNPAYKHMNFYRCLAGLICEDRFVGTPEPGDPKNNLSADQGIPMSPTLARHRAGYRRTPASVRGGK